MGSDLVKIHVVRLKLTGTACFYHFHWLIATLWQVSRIFLLHIVNARRLCVISFLIMDDFKINWQTSTKLHPQICDFNRHLIWFSCQMKKVKKYLFARILLFQDHAWNINISNFIKWNCLSLCIPGLEGCYSGVYQFMLQILYLLWCWLPCH